MDNLTTFPGCFLTLLHVGLQQVLWLYRSAVDSSLQNLSAVLKLHHGILKWTCIPTLNTTQPLKRVNKIIFVLHVKMCSFDFISRVGGNRHRMWGLIIISVSLNLNIVPGYSQQPVYVPSNRVFQWNNPYNSSPGQNSWHGQGAHQHHGDHYPAQTPAHFTNSFYAAQTTMMWRTYPSSFQGSLNYGQFIAFSTTIFIYMEKWNS